MIRILTILLLTIPLFSSTLDGLIAYAMKHSTMVKQSQAQMELAQANREESTSAQFGSIDLVGSYTRFNLPRTLIPLTPATIATDAKAVATTKNLFSTGVMYSIPLFTGFAQTRQVEMDSIATRLSQSKLSLTKEQLAFNVASLYLSILALQDMTNAQTKHVEALKKLKNTISDEVKFGKKAQIDLLKAENDLYGNISYLEVIKGNIAIAKASLASLVGMDHIGTINPIKVSVKKPNYSISGLLGKSASLDKVIIAELNLKKAGKGIEKSESSMLPQVSLSSYYGYNYGENDSSNFYSGEFENEKNWQVGLNAKWTLYDFGKRDATTQKAKIARMQAEFDKQQTLLDLKKSLIEASEKMKQEYANYRSNAKQLTLAKKSEKIENVRYHNGVSTINDLLYAKSQTHLASAKLIESKYNYQKGKFYMDYLLERGYKPTSSDRR
jgi:outer membrane protein TolC